MQTELGFDPSAPAPPPPPSTAKAGRGGAGKGGAKGKGKGNNGQDPAEVEEEDPTGLRFLAKAGLVVVEAPAGSGVFVVDAKQSCIDLSAGSDRTLL